MEEVIPEIEDAQLSAPSQSCRDASLEGIQAEVQHLQPAQLTKLRRHSPAKVVDAKVEFSEEGEVAQERRDTSTRQVKRVEVQRDDPLGVSTAASDSSPPAQGVGRVP